MSGRNGRRKAGAGTPGKTGPKRGSEQRGYSVRETPEGSGRWEVRVYAGDCRLCGKRVSVSRTVRGGRRDATDLGITLRGDRAVLMAAHVEREHPDREPDVPTVGTLVTAWWAWVQQGTEIAGSTAATDDGIVRKHLTGTPICDVPLTALDTQRVRDWYRDLTAAGLTPATVRRVRGVLSRACAWGVEQGRLPANPVVSARPPTVQSPLPRVADGDHVAALMRHLAGSDPVMHAWLVLEASMGARAGELLALRWRDVDLRRRVVYVEAVVERVRGGVNVRPSTKNKRGREVALGGAVVEAMRAHRAWAEKRAADAGVALVTDAFVFSNEADGSAPIRPDSASRRVRKAVRRSVGDVRDMEMRKIRHYVHTALQDQGVPVAVVAQRAGNRPETLLRHYAGVTRQARQAAAEIADGLVPDSV